METSLCYFLSHVQLFATAWAVACQTSLYMIIHTRILEWAAIPFSWQSSQPSPTQGSNLGLLQYRKTLYCLNH